MTQSEIDEAMGISASQRDRLVAGQVPEGMAERILMPIALRYPRRLEGWLAPWLVAASVLVWAIVALKGSVVVLALVLVAALGAIARSAWRCERELLRHRRDVARAWQGGITQVVRERVELRTALHPAWTREGESFERWALELERDDGQVLVLGYPHSELVPWQGEAEVVVGKLVLEGGAWRPWTMAVQLSARSCGA